MLPYLIATVFIVFICALEVARQFNAGRYHLLSFAEHRSIFYPFYVLGWIFTRPLHPPVPPPPPPAKPVFDLTEYRMIIEDVATRFRAHFADEDFIIGLKSATARTLYDCEKPAEEKGIHPLAYLQQTLQTPDPAQRICQVALEAYGVFENGLPAWCKSPFLASFAELMPSTTLFDQFFHVFEKTSPIFDDVLKTYYRNYYAALPQVQDGALEKGSWQYYEILLMGCPFNLLFNRTFAAGPPEERRFGGTWVIAPPGAGKSTVLSNLIKLDLEKVRTGDASIILLDTKGELSNYLRRLKRFAPGGDLEDKLVLLEPSTDLAINLLDLAPNLTHSTQLLDYLLSFGLEMTDRQTTLMTMILKVMDKKPGATFGDFFRFLVEGSEPFLEEIGRLKESDRDFFLKTIQGMKGKPTTEFNDYEDTRKQIMTRVRGLVGRAPLLGDMFTAKETKFKLAELMDAGKVIIIDNREKHLGPEGSEFFGRLILSILYSEAMQGRENKIPVYCYLDDCNEVIGRDENVNRILTKCRSQKIAMILAHQKMVDIPSIPVKQALKDCAVRIGHPDEEISELAHRFRMTPQKLQGLHQHQFALFVSGIMKEGIVIDIPNDPVKHWEPMEDRDFRAIRAKMRKEYCEEQKERPVAPPPPVVREYSDEAGESG